MIDWTGCPLVVRREGYLGGGPALRDDPRVMPEVVDENMDDGMTAKEVVEVYELETPVADVEAIYRFAVRQRGLVLPQVRRKTKSILPACFRPAQ